MAATSAAMTRRVSFPIRVRNPDRSKRESAIHQVNVPRRVAGLIGREIHGQCRYFLRRAEPAHGLAVDEGLTHRLQTLAGAFGLGCDALVERRRLDRAGADRIGAHTALDE